MARTRIAIRRRYVQTEARPSVLVVFPFDGSITRHPLSSTGSPQGRIPLLHGYYGMLRLPTALPDALRCLRLPVPPATDASLPSAVRGAPTGRGLRSRSAFPHAALLEWRRPGLSSSWRTPAYVPCSQTPAGPSRQAIRRVGAAFRFSHSVGSRDSVLSRLNHTARTPAVYASQDGSLRHHARLASGCRPHFAGQDASSCRVPTKGFNHVSQHRIPLSQAFLTQTKRTQLKAKRTQKKTQTNPIKPIPAAAPTSPVRRLVKTRRCRSPSHRQPRFRRVKACHRTTRRSRCAGTWQCHRPRRCRGAHARYDPAR